MPDHDLRPQRAGVVKTQDQQGAFVRGGGGGGMQRALLLAVLKKRQTKTDTDRQTARTRGLTDGPTILWTPRSSSCMYAQVEA